MLSFNIAQAKCLNHAKLVSGNRNDKTFLKIKLYGVTTLSGAPLACDRQFLHFSATTCTFGLLLPTVTKAGNLSSQCMRMHACCIF